jgi:5-methylcytosine-specific restriction endonuclease McrA
MAKDYNLTARIRSALRKIWAWSPMRREAIKRSMLSYGRYKCAACKDVFGLKFVKVDHVVPVTPFGGITSWDEYINRLFCPVEGLQILCEYCHNSKTAEERKERSAAKKAAAA